MPSTAAPNLDISMPGHGGYTALGWAISNTMNTTRCFALLITLILLATIGSSCSKRSKGQGDLSDSLKRQADEFVHERHQRWCNRARHVPEVVAGVARDKVLELLGEPDMKSDSPTVENWLYKYDCARNEEQIWIDGVVVQIAAGKVTNVMRAPTRLGIQEMLERAAATTRKESGPDAPSK